MKFTGANLLILRNAVIGGIDSVEMYMGQCCEPEKYPEAIAEPESEIEDYQKILARIDKAIERGDA